MKSWNLIFRRAHLYLGMLLLPWLLIYGVSTLLLNHEWFRQFRPADPQFVQIWEKEYTLAVPVRPDNLREVGQRILADNGLEGPFSVQRQGQRLNVNMANFMEPKRLVYDLQANRLMAEKKKFFWMEALVRMHFRTGYGHPGALTKVWAVVVDVFCVSMLMWIFTGLYLWWKIRSSRGWGWAAIGAGAGMIAVLLMTV